MGNAAASHRKDLADPTKPLVRLMLEDVTITEDGNDFAIKTFLPRLKTTKRTRPKKEKTNRQLHVQAFGDLPKQSTWKRPEYYYPAMIPEPDYTDSEEENEHKEKTHCSQASGSNGAQPLISEDGLIQPKKVQNPCLESTERKNLHKELMFNQKIGKNLLGQKSELQKVMDKFREDHKKKELEEERLNKRSSFEKRLEEQANKIRNVEEDEIKKNEELIDQPEFLRVHARVRAHAVQVDTES